MHSAEVWELEERWKEKETVHCKYSFKKSGKDIHGCGQPSTQNEIKKTQQKTKGSKTESEVAASLVTHGRTGYYGICYEQQITDFTKES